MTCWNSRSTAIRSQFRQGPARWRIAIGPLLCIACSGAAALLAAEALKRLGFIEPIVAGSAGFNGWTGAAVVQFKSIRQGCRVWQQLDTRRLPGRAGDDRQRSA